MNEEEKKALRKEYLGSLFKRLEVWLNAVPGRSIELKNTTAGVGTKWECFLSENEKWVASSMMIDGDDIHYEKGCAHSVGVALDSAENYQLPTLRMEKVTFQYTEDAEGKIDIQNKTVENLLPKTRIEQEIFTIDEPLDNGAVEFEKTCAEVSSWIFIDLNKK